MSEIKLYTENTMHKKTTHWNLVNGAKNDVDKYFKHTFNKQPLSDSRKEEE